MILTTYMEEIRKEFVVFMKDHESRLLKIGISLTDYPIDHACYRVSTLADFERLFKEFGKISVLYTTKIFHERKFCMFVLRQPLTYKSFSVSYLEFAQPGGSDDYDRGFQHIEFITNVKIGNISKQKKKISKLLFVTKRTDEEYLKWPDKVSLKVRSVPLVSQALLEDNPEIIVPTIKS